MIAAPAAGKSAGKPADQVRLSLYRLSASRMAILMDSPRGTDPAAPGPHGHLFDSLGHTGCGMPRGRVIHRARRPFDRPAV